MFCFALACIFAYKQQAINGEFYIQAFHYQAKKGRI